MSEESLPEKADINISEIQKTIKEVIQIDGKEWPDDKEVTISVEFIVVPKTMDIKISKK